MATTVSLKPNAVEISGSTSGTTTLQATAVAGTTTLTLPAATDTLVGKATTDTLTNKTLTGAAMNGTLGATTPSTVAATSISASTTLGVTGVSTLTGGAVIEGLTVGKGAGAVSTNTAVGASALAANTSGALNVAVGTSALVANTTASNNTAVGYQAGYTNVTGPDCTFIGRQAGYLSTGTRNTFIGAGTGYSTTGTYNTFVGTISAAGGACGEAVTTGTKNSIFGAYNGNQEGLNIITASNAIVLSDGDGFPKYYSQNGVNTDYNYSNVSLTAGVAYDLVPIKSIYPYLGAVNAAVMTVVVTGSNSIDGGYAGYFILSLTQAFGTYTVTVINSGLPHNNSGYSFTFGLTSSFLTVTAGKTTSMSYSAIVVTGSDT